MQTVYQRPRYSDVGIFYQVTPGYYKVQWVGGSETPSASLNIVGSSAASTHWRSHTTQSKERLPIVPESPKVDIGKIKVLCLSSDSDSPGDDGSDAEGLPSGVTAKPFASSSCDRDYHFDDDCSPLLNKSILNEVVATTLLGDPSKCGGSSQASASRSGSTNALKTRDSGSLGLHCSPSVGDKSKILSPMTPGTPLKDFGSLSVSGSTTQSKSSGLYSMQQSSDGPSKGISKSIMLLLLRMGRNKSSRSVLKTSDLSAFKHEVVKYLPIEYNRDCIFELPPVAIVKEGGLSRLDGMDRKRDGHVWTETTTTNISDPSGILTFKYVKCMGHLRCLNPYCRCVCETGDCNELYWSGSCLDILTPGLNLEGVGKCKLVCKYCKVIPSYLAVCHCKLFYAVSKDPNISRTCIHIGTHKHPIAKGDCRDAMDQIRRRLRSRLRRLLQPRQAPSELRLGRSCS